jgi:3-deoxy-D-manno-octulosonate 8-phosphate phosphatase (KDO 8-P phosphatase)
MQNLGVKHVYQGQLHKLPAFEELVLKTGLTLEQVAYVGDDVVDLPLLIRAGLAITVQDGHELAKQHAHWVTPSRGGHGAARDICEMIMRAQNTYDGAMQIYFA